MLAFVKLGGSLITDKSRPETPRPEQIAMLAETMAQALVDSPTLSLLVGHGSGSYGHSVASQYGTHRGASSPEEWRGFAEVAAAANRLNHLVTEAMIEAGIPVFRIQPSASALCHGGELQSMAITPIRRTLEAGLVPLIHGDACIDDVQGSTIISTEEILTLLARNIPPDRLLLPGDYEGVKGQFDSVIPSITRDNLDEVLPHLGGSAHTDVTGGMASKVISMLDLASEIPNLKINIFSGHNPDNLYQALVDPGFTPGTTITA